MQDLCPLINDVVECGKEIYEALQAQYQLLGSCKERRDFLSKKWDDEQEKMINIQLSPEVEKKLSYIENYAKENIANLKRQMVNNQVALDLLDGIETK